MALYPEVQRAAHAEIDAVLGDSRLPDFCDEEKLPYIGAVLKEVFRWHPVAPLGGCRQPESYMDLTLAELGIPHRVTKGDIYEGYFIPAGSMVIGNGWSAIFLDGSTITLNSNTFFYLGRCYTTLIHSLNPVDLTQSAGSHPAHLPFQMPHSVSGGVNAPGASWPETACGPPSRACWRRSRYRQWRMIRRRSCTRLE